MKRLMLLLCLLMLRSVAGEAPLRRGFNLLEMFIWSPAKTAPKFQEQDFQFIRENGFNFVRLPLDYRFWIADGQWDRIDEAKLAPIDEAVALGAKYGVHVQLCFHRIPGYTVARPAEPRNLFTDDEALRVAVLHWRTFAKRYKDIPSDRVSFNLFNEPANATEEQYEKVGKALIEAIRAEDPDRLIVADGLDWASKPVKSLFKYNIEQAARGYWPMSVSHYKASWVGTPTETPIWPPSRAMSPLFGPVKKPWDVPLTLTDLPPCRVTIHPGRTSGKVRLVAEADGKEVLNLVLEPGTDGLWTNVQYHAQWHIAQGTCLSSYAFELPGSVKRLTLRVTEGDWMGLDRIEFRIGEKVQTLGFTNSWGMPDGRPVQFMGSESADAGLTAIRGRIALWQPAFEAKVPVMVGEFGAFNYTPHDVVLRWMEDNLKVWKENRLGWALWNLRGSFGVLDSDRKDVVYEDWHGRKLDRKMLELLKKY